jgi:GT2 family glycosyltransferase
MPFPKCRLVVPVHNALRYLEPMLASLREHTQQDFYELVVVDDASGEETRTYLDGLPEAVRVERHDTNEGFSAACNRGAAGVCCEFLVFLNSDLEFRPGWLEALVSCAEEDDSVGAVGCRLLYPDGTIQHGGVFLREDRLDRVPLAASHDHVGKGADDPEAAKQADLLAVTAAAILVRRKAFEQVGGFDEGYFNGLEDVDFCLRLRRQGWRVVYEPACTLVHHESKSGSGRFLFARRNERKFVETWLGRVRPEVLVTPECDVLPHPDWEAAAPFRDYSEAPERGNVRIVVSGKGSVGAMALTLESVFAARIGLYDAVHALIPEGDADAAAYLALCEGLDDAFAWERAAALETVCSALREDFVALVEPGTVVTQGWLSRLTRWAAQEGVGIAAPMLSGVSGAQDGLGLLAPGTKGAFHPNDLSNAFSKSFHGQASAAAHLHPACLVMRAEPFREAIAAGAKTIDGVQRHLASQGLVLAAAKDVFVHIDNRDVTLAGAA